MKFLSIVLSVVALAGFAQINEQVKPTTIFLVRHAERANDGTNDPPISDDGKNRATKLAEVLKNSGVTAIYSTNYQRTRTTIEPLAKAQNLDIKMYEAMKEPELKRIVEENRGGVVVICGHSNTTPWSANFLAGTKLENFNDADYGNILIVTFWDYGKASLTRVSY
jgi:broad specificity phosphatase PhoE